MAYATGLIRSEHAAANFNQAYRRAASREKVSRQPAGASATRNP
jgi:hypothetical protein